LHGITHAFTPSNSLDQRKKAGEDRAQGRSLIVGPLSEAMAALRGKLGAVRDSGGF